MNFFSRFFGKIPQRAEPTALSIKTPPVVLMGEKNPLLIKTSDTVLSMVVFASSDVADELLKVLGSDPKQWTLIYLSPKLIQRLPDEFTKNDVMYFRTKRDAHLYSDNRATFPYAEFLVPLNKLEN